MDDRAADLRKHAGVLGTAARRRQGAAACCAVLCAKRAAQAGAAALRRLAAGNPFGERAGGAAAADAWRGRAPARRPAAGEGFSEEAAQRRGDHARPSAVRRVEARPAAVRGPAARPLHHALVAGPQQGCRLRAVDLDQLGLPARQHRPPAGQHALPVPVRLLGRARAGPRPLSRLLSARRRWRPGPMRARAATASAHRARCRR
jgi:hypothetical protein